MSLLTPGRFICVMVSF